MSRRKGTPCACECDPCGSKKCIKAINNVSGDPNGDFEIKAGNGIGISQSGDNSITIINQAMASSFVAGSNIEINPSGDDLEIRVTDDISVNDIDAAGDVNISGDTNIGGTLNIAGDIIQQGAAYETHAEKIYTTNDYIYMREGAVGGLASGSYAGFEIIKYDGVNDGRLVIDNTGTARVGDVGTEQPLLTREESANLNNGALLKWDAANLKAVDEGTVGSDTKPIKIVNGVATPVTNTLARGDVTGEQITVNGCVLNKVRIGNILFISLQDGTPLATGDYNIITNAVEGTQYGIVPIMTGGNVIVGYLFGQPSGVVTMRISQVLAGTGFHATYLINL